MVSFGMVLAGAVFATDQTDGINHKNATNLNVTVLDENGNPAVDVCRGDNVTTQITANSSKVIKDPFTKITVDPEHGIKFLPDEAQMWDGNSWIQNDPCDPFLYKDDGSWIWDMGKVLCPGTNLILKIPGVVCNIGETTVTADLYGEIAKFGHKDKQCTYNNDPWNQRFNQDNNYINDPNRCDDHHQDIRLLNTASYQFNASVCTDASVKVNILDPDNTNLPISTTPQGDEVVVEVIADAANEFIKDPDIFLTFNPVAALNFDPAEVTMWDGTSWITNDPNNNPFFFEVTSGVWKWEVGDIMNPGDVFKLMIPAIAAEAGKVNVTADFYGMLKCDPNDPTDTDFLPSTLLDNDTTILNITSGSAAGGGEEPAAGGNAAGSVVSAANTTSVPMQTTGAPLVMAVLALFAIIGGSIYGRLK